MSVGKFIRQRLKDNKMTAKELAAKSGKNHTYLSRVITGHQNASPELLRAIAPHLEGASLQELMVAAGHLTPDDEQNNETLEDLELRIGDLHTKLSGAIAKYVRASDDSEDGYDGDMEIEALNNVFKVLMDCVRSKTIREQFGFAEDQESLDMVKGINSLYRKQKRMLYPLLEELNIMNAAAKRY